MNPKLEKWLSLKESATDIVAYEVFFRSIVKAKRSGPKNGEKILFLATRDLLRTSSNPRDDFINADSLSYELGENLLEMLTGIGHEILEKHDGIEFIESVRLLTQATQLSPLRFLFCWSLFNTNQLELCIQECEKEQTPTNPFFTLQGQAYLEIGRIKEACETLTIAHELDRKDTLCLFQLAKASLLDRNFEAACNSIQRCKALVGQNQELTALSIMLIEQCPSLHKLFIDETKRDLIYLFETEPLQIDWLEMGISLAINVNDQTLAQDLLSKYQFSVARDTHKVASAVGRLIRSLARKNWHKVIAALSNRGVEVLQKNQFEL